METKEKILEASLRLLEEQGDPDKVTLRAIAAEAGVGLGLINYYYDSRDKLMAACTEVAINRVVERFTKMRDDAQQLDPFEKLRALGEITFTYLVEHEALSRMSMLTDVKHPHEQDNTERTTRAFIPLIRECRPDLTDEQINAKAFALISAMQMAFLRNSVLAEKGTNLKDVQQRRALHDSILCALGLTRQSDGAASGAEPTE